MGNEEGILIMSEKDVTVSYAEQILDLIREAEKNRFYGKITIQFSDGVISPLVRKEETVIYVDKE